MNLALKFHPNPYRFLLYTEWVMLASCSSLAIVEAFVGRRIPVQHISILLVLGVMGLGLPVGSVVIKLLYTCIEVGLIFYGATLGYLHILPTLYLIVLIRSCFLFDRAERLLIAGLSFLLFLIHHINYVQKLSLVIVPGEQSRFWMHSFAETLVFGVGLFLVMKLVESLIAEQRSQTALAAAHQQLRQYAQQAEDLAAAQERNRIAREIHDSLGHALTALNVQLQTAMRLWSHDPHKAEPFVEQAQKLGVVAMREVRQSIGALREQATVRSLPDAIAPLIDDFRQGTGIETKTNIAVDVPLSPAIAQAIYRILQEALTNISRHAEATAVAVEVRTTSGAIELTVADNGRGILPNAQSSGFGLQGMQERVAVFKGDLKLETQPGAGCRVVAVIPLQSIESVPRTVG